MMAAVTVAAPCLCAITITLWRRCSKPLMQVAPEAEAQPAKLFMPKDHQKPEGGPDVRNHHHANTPLWIRFLPSYSGVLSHCVFVVCFVSTTFPWESDRTTYAAPQPASSDSLFKLSSSMALGCVGAGYDGAAANRAGGRRQRAGCLPEIR